MTPEISRRQFLKVAAGAALAPVELFAQEEKAGQSMESVVFQTPEGYFIVREGEKYKLPDGFEKYSRGTKLSEHGRQVQSVGSLDLPEAKVELLDQVIDSISGNLKNHNRNASMPLVVPGFIDKGNNGLNPVLTIDPGGTFEDLLGRFQKNGWSYKFDTLALKRRKAGEGLDTVGDTLSNPKDHIKNMGEQIKLFKKDFPFTQLVAFGFSLGGVELISAAMEHPDVFNDIVLIESPIRGVPRSWETTTQQIAIKTGVAIAFQAYEHVTDYLMGLWDDKDYQKKLVNFVKDFTSSGKRIVSVTLDTDGIAKRDWCVCSGIEELAIHGDPQGDTADGALPNHGPALRDNLFLDFSENLVGPNPNS